MSIWKISRRSLLVGASGATAVAGAGGLWLGMRKIRSWGYRNAVERDDHVFSPSAFLAIDTNGEVVVWLTRSEMGQGISTALPMIVAEELDADWQTIRVEQAVSGDGIDYGSLYTAASASVSGLWVTLSRAGAVARDMLTNAAAKQWGVSATSCRTQSGRVFHDLSGQSVGYGEVAEAAARQWAPLRPALKTPNDYQLIGQSLPRLDIPDKVTGVARFGIDWQMPDMRRAVISRPPGFGYQLRGYEAADALAVDDVERVIELKAGIAVVASSTAAALKGCRALRVNWQAPEETVSNPSIDAALASGLDAPPTSETQRTGKPELLFRHAEQTQTDSLRMAEFTVPYLPHLCMEPMNCAVSVCADRCELWVSTQDPQGARRAAARVSGLPEAAIAVHTQLLGGGFGRRTAEDFVVDAIELGQKLSQPVQVLWTREEDLRNALYRPAAKIRLKALLDEGGTVAAWHHRVAAASARAVAPGSNNAGAVMGARSPGYQLGEFLLDWRAVQLPIPTMIWRAVGSSFNTFAIECFIDELAEAAGIDPVTMPRRLLEQTPRIRRCLDKVVDMAAWHPSDSRFVGFATHRFGRTAVAQIVEVSGSDLQSFSIDRVWCAIDCGTVVNPDGVAAQVESGIVDGLSTALYGGLKINDNVIEQGNFDVQPILRMSQTPEIKVALMPSRERPSGVGEASLPGTLPALANALYTLTGRRVRTLPILGG